MKKPVDLYDSHDGRVEEDVYRAIRVEAFDEVQRFLAMVHTLSRERRLSRFAFVGEKPAGAA